MIKIFVVDDHPIIREGVAAILNEQKDMVLIGEAADGADAIEQFETLLPDITLMDIQMPHVNGTQAITTIISKHPEAKIIVLTTYAGDVQAARAIKAGARGYLLKSSLRREMLEVIRAVSQGSRHVDAGVAGDLAFSSNESGLAERETAVLRLVAIGYANKQIAKALGISEETVKAHLKSVFAKLKVSDRTHAVTEAVRRGIIEL
jgi:DNA-binding NarL/FixJ family response regulator